MKTNLLGDLDINETGHASQGGFGDGPHDLIIN